jgi:hypothetical protein
MIKKISLFIILTMNLIAKEINKETITNYIYINPETKQEYKVIIEGSYYKIKITPGNIFQHRSKEVDDILAYIKRENLIISRKKNTLQICQVKKCKCKEENDLK